MSALITMKNLSLLSQKQKGFSLVEVMIAILIGLILLTGLIKVFDTSSSLNRTQNGLARIQENGRYAIESMKRNLEQAGYVYCFGRSSQPIAPGMIPPKNAWILDVPAPSLPGFAVGTFDPAFLIHGHECSGGGCNPALNTLGSGADSGIPAAGISDGDRIIGTDVITVRYLRGSGKEVDSVTGASDSPANTIYFSQFDQANPSATPMPATGQVLLVGCAEKTPPQLVSVMSASVGEMSVTTTPLAQFGVGTFTKAFDFQRDFVTVTYYVANNIVDGRSIPTLYSRINGVVNQVVQGVDAFDVLYGVKINDGTGGVQYLTADQVDSLAAINCSPVPRDVITSEDILNPAVNCGWRSVVALDVHLLLNTIFNSSTNPNEQFSYSPYGVGYFNATDLPAAGTPSLPRYNMYRKEFYTSVSLKNIVD